MKVPKAKKLSSGKWYIYLRLGGQKIPVTGPDEKTCIRNAQQVKADWLAQKRLPDELKPQPAPDLGPTLGAAIDAYIRSRDKVLSPSTVLGYEIIRRNRFRGLMDRPASSISVAEWQRAINAEVSLAAPKTVKNAYEFIRTALRREVGISIPADAVKLPSVPPADTAVLQPEEIRAFVAAIKDDPVAVPALLALSSLRLSELTALRWENIPPKPDLIRVRGAVVRNSKFELTAKKQNKNASSARNVPVLIPELAAAIERDRRPEGPVLSCKQSTLRKRVHDACQRAGVTDVTLHGLRHSFASLCYHLGVPEKNVMEMGGWSDIGTMRKIYTHIAQSDISRYRTALADFYAPPKEPPEENAN